MELRESQPSLTVSGSLRQIENAEKRKKEEKKKKKKNKFE